MHAGDSLLPVALDQEEGTGAEMDDKTIDFTRLVHLVDDAGLIRLGLKLMERVAKMEGRVLWH
jgi:hypothetical protein